MRKALNNLLKRWFTQADTEPQQVAAPTTPQKPAEIPSPDATAVVTAVAPATIPEPLKPEAPAKEQEVFVAWKPRIAVDAIFFDWVMGYPGEGSSMETEQKILQALFALLASDLNDAVVVPRVPTVIPQLLNSLRNKSVSASELAQHIVKDVVLVGELINAVNSSLYNPADRINSLDKAIMILGEDGLRLLIAKVAFRPIINLSSGQYTRRAAPHIWNQSEKCAIACHQLAVGQDPFQAFLTGLMKNVGLIIAFRLLDQVCEEPRFKYSRGFSMAFTSAAATLSYRVAQRWGFPAEVVQALQQQAGGSKAPTWAPLGHLLHTADLLSKMRVLVNHGQLKSGDEHLRVGMSPQAAACFDTLNDVNLYEQGGSEQKLLTE
ncbi:HDOD domain-containing protein [Undibacterium sp. TJN25]|uniref:HDOD domain-containing protein n=1 Tax=Undibacterium sp. TJN25 TaxID=3413056 RepID=UPI003BEF7202